MKILSVINFVIAVVFTCCYTYQFIFIPIVWARSGKSVSRAEPKNHNYAVLICARNESEVISDLIFSIRNQTYPKEYITTFVIADNCNDNTASIARGLGAVVYERTDQNRVGKGIALEVLLSHIRDDFGDVFDGFFVFDADNILASNYIEEMNRTFSEGHDIITSYRNSKNFGSNWISAGYALWFLRESRYLNHARYILHSSCAVSGTGFLFSRRVLDEMGTWPYHTLTEDIEFSIDMICRGHRIAFCAAAELYDEQPVLFKESWNQRMRWSRGYLQVFGKHGKKLIKGMLHGSFPCFDMSMTIMPAYILSAVSLITNLALCVIGAVSGKGIVEAIVPAAEMLCEMYLLLFVLGLITTVTEWKHIHAKPGEKILSAFTFPLFMITYIPIAFAALFSNTGWKPIKHTYSVKKLTKEGYADIGEMTNNPENN